MVLYHYQHKWQCQSESNMFLLLSHRCAADTAPRDRELWAGTATPSPEQPGPLASCYRLTGSVAEAQGWSPSREQQARQSVVSVTRLALYDFLVLMNG